MKKLTISQAAKPRQYPETATQITIVDTLKEVLPKGYRAVAVPNGGKRKPQAAARSKRLGELPGFPDLAVFGPDNFAAFMEVKSKTGTASDSQKDVMFWLSDCGFPVAIVKDLDHALSFLAANGVKLRGRVT
jgi:hypothetical protein